MCEIGAILCGDQRALQHGPPVKAMLIQNTNPMLVSPDLGKVRKGLQRKDLFVCVHEQVMTETAMLADLVLPATTFVEHDDMYRSYGHTFIQVANKVIEPIADCRSNHDVLGKLMQKLDASATNFSATVKQDIADTLALSGYPQPEQFTEQHFLDCAPSFNEAHFIDGFAWPDGLFRFAPDWKAIGPGGENMPIMPDHWEVTDERNAEHPLRLVAAPSSGFLNSSFNTSPSSIKREKKPWLKIHPDTAAQYQIKNEAQVMVGNSKGSVTLTASLMQQIQHDTVVVEGIWPANAFPEGIGINVLISAEPASPNGGAVFHDTAVWVKPVSTP
jgi:anaerobic selenocysteine-containing dehydrogenase